MGNGSGFNGMGGGGGGPPLVQHPFNTGNNNNNVFNSELFLNYLGQ